MLHIKFYICGNELHYRLIVISNILYEYKQKTIYHIQIFTQIFGYTCWEFKNIQHILDTWDLDSPNYKSNKEFIDNQ